MMKKETEKQKKKDRQQILEGVRVALLRSFRGQRCKKCLVRGDLDVSRTFRKANSHFNPTRLARGPHHSIETPFK